MKTPSAAEVVVQRQVDAFHARDLDALVATYSPDAELFEHPMTCVAKGTAELRERFRPRMSEPNLHATLLQRIVVGTRVIDHERVTRTFAEAPGEMELVMIYEVREDRIAKAWIIAGEKKLIAS